MFRKLLNDENGFIVSAELMLLITLSFCMAAVGWAAVRDALVNELNDVSHAIGAVSQSYKDFFNVGHDHCRGSSGEILVSSTSLHGPVFEYFCNNQRM